MPYFATAELTKVDLPSADGYWVKISNKYTYAESKAIDRAGNDEDDWADTDTILLSVIKEWNLDDEAGTVREINAENIDLLKEEDVLAIINCGKNLNAESADSKKNSSKTPEPTSAEAQ